MKYTKGVSCPQRGNQKKLTGDKNANWKGGTFTNSLGYVWVYTPKHPNACRTSPKGYVFEHRLVMELSLGRYLEGDEVVHHINGIRNDNRIENLFLTHKGKHIGDHNKTRVWKEESKKKQSVNTQSFKRNTLGRFIN